MKLLHTGDWHIGKTLRGRSRLAEHERVLAEIVDIARDEAVDVVAIAGDIFETSVPAPEAQRVAWNALLALRATGAEVFAIAGNHDSASSFDAMRPLCAAAGIHLFGHPVAARNGGVVEITTRSGQKLRMACLPFVSQRFAVRSHELFELSGAAATNEYTTDYRHLVRHLVAATSPGTTSPGATSNELVTVLLAHATVLHATFGGGEREAHSIFEYAVPASVFPIEAHYVALGHLHRTQSVAAGCPVWYCGSPIQVDFGEGSNTPQVLIVEMQPNAPAKVRGVEIASADRLLTIEATLSELTAMAPQLQDAWLRVRLHESMRAGLADEVRALLPRVVDVMITQQHDPTDSTPRATKSRAGRSGADLFGEFLTERGIDDPRVVQLFNEMLSESS